MFADLKNDFVFRRIFANHPDLTAALLNDLLDRRGDETIVSLSLLSPEQAPVVAGSKLSVLDLKARDQGGRTFVVEMQLLHMSGFLNRVVESACKAYVAPLAQGGQYTALTDVIAVSLCDFVLWPDGQEATADVPLVSRWSMRERVSGRDDLLQVQYAFVELPKVAPSPPHATAAETWAWLFRFGKTLDEVPGGLSGPQRSALALAEEATFTLAESEAYRRVADEIEQARQLAEDALLRGRREGEEKGLERGRREAILDLAEVLGLEVTEERRTRLAALDGAGLDEVRAAVRAMRGWPEGW